MEEKKPRFFYHVEFRRIFFVLFDNHFLVIHLSGREKRKYKLDEDSLIFQEYFCSLLSLSFSKVIHLSKKGKEKKNMYYIIINIFIHTLVKGKKRKEKLN